MKTRLIGVAVCLWGSMGMAEGGHHGRGEHARTLEDLNARCREFASVASSTQNCRSLAAELWRSMSEEQRRIARDYISADCRALLNEPPSRHSYVSAERQRCLYRSVEVSRLVLEAGRLGGCHLGVGGYPVCDWRGRALAFRGLSIGDVRYVSGLRYRQTPVFPGYYPYMPMLAGTSY